MVRTLPVNISTILKDRLVDGEPVEVSLCRVLVPGRQDLSQIDDNDVTIKSYYLYVCKYIREVGKTLQKSTK